MVELVLRRCREGALGHVADVILRDGVGERVFPFFTSVKNFECVWRDLLRLSGVVLDILDKAAVGVPMRMWFVKEKWLFEFGSAVDLFTKEPLLFLDVAKDTGNLKIKFRVSDG